MKPALQETDKVLSILADQNKVLADLARNSDIVLAPLAAQRQASPTSSSRPTPSTRPRPSAAPPWGRTSSSCPRFLTELRPTLARVNGLSDEMVPLLQDLHAQAPAINQLVERLGPFSTASRPAIRSLGIAAQAGIPATKAFNPIVNQLGQFTRAAKPVAANLSAILSPSATPAAWSG